MLTGSSSGSPMMGRALTGDLDLGEASRMVGSAQEVVHRRGGKLGWWLGLGQDFMKARIANELFIGGK
jgi:hypothetical protein